MDRVLDQLPEARRQAHERIIGERKIENADKILSLYDPDVHVIVRGKAGANVEFGNSLFLVENAEGFIIDHELKREASPGDSKWLKERYETIREKCAGALAGVVGGRLRKPPDPSRLGRARPQPLGARQAAQGR